MAVRIEVHHHPLSRLPHPDKIARLLFKIDECDKIARWHHLNYRRNKYYFLSYGYTKKVDKRKASHHPLSKLPHHDNISGFLFKIDECNKIAGWYHVITGAKRTVLSYGYTEQVDNRRASRHSLSRLPHPDKIAGLLLKIDQCDETAGWHHVITGAKSTMSQAIDILNKWTTEGHHAIH